MTSVKIISVVIFILFKITTAGNVCPASGSIQTVLRESPLFQNVKPKIKGIVETTTSARSECARQCYHLSDCQSMFYSTTDNVCLLYDDQVTYSTFEKYVGMRRFDVENDVPADCYEVVKKGIQTDGVYFVKPRDSGEPISVYCEISNGGWLVFQRRTDGSEDFYRTWNEYKDGFGNLNSEFWLGNTNIHRMTTQGLYELRVDLEDFEGNMTYAFYKNFSIAGEEKYFQLSVANYSGTAVDALGWHNGCYFSTKDKDLDNSPLDCAKDYTGAWWYKYCFRSNLNGMYSKTKNEPGTIRWFDPNHGSAITVMKITVMKIRPSNFVP